MRKPCFSIYNTKTKAQIKCLEMPQLFSAFGLATYTEQSLLLSKSEISILNQTSVAVQPGLCLPSWKPLGQVFL